MRTLLRIRSLIRLDPTLRRRRFSTEIGLCRSWPSVRQLNHSEQPVTNDLARGRDSGREAKIHLDAVARVRTGQKLQNWRARRVSLMNQSVCAAKAAK